MLTDDLNRANFIFSEEARERHVAIPDVRRAHGFDIGDGVSSIARELPCKGRYRANAGAPARWRADARQTTRRAKGRVYHLRCNRAEERGATAAAMASGAATCVAR